MRTVFLLFFGLVIAASAIGCLNTSCTPQEARGVNRQCSGGARGFIWTGTSCIYTVACNCTGPDCQRLYSTQDGCETAHFHCH